jgi:hypothetical protein
MKKNFHDKFVEELNQEQSYNENRQRMSLRLGDKEKIE